MIKVGPKAGTKYNVAMNANNENPMEMNRPGKEGTGSKNGRTINHEATGAKPRRIVEDSARGWTAVDAMVVVEEKDLHDVFRRV